MVLSSLKRGRLLIALTGTQPSKLLALHSRIIRKDNVDYASAAMCTGSLDGRHAADWSPLLHRVDKKQDREQRDRKRDLQTRLTVTARWVCDVSRREAAGADAIREDARER